VVEDVLCFDFASLYPSVIRGYNISFETLSLVPKPGYIEYVLDDKNFGEDEKKVYILPSHIR
jgi:DNA polymerase elongation subunit (family B)